MNLLARIPTREYQDMNLSAHIITCSSLIMNLPAHDNMKHIPNQDQHHKPCKTYHNAPCHYTSPSTARRNGSTDRLAVPHHRRAPQLTRNPCFLLSPGGPLYTARRYTNNVTLLVLGTLIHFLPFTHSILKHPKINKHIHIFQITTSQHTLYFPLLIFPTLCMLTIHIPHIRHNQTYILILHALTISITFKV